MCSYRIRQGHTSARSGARAPEAWRVEWAPWSSLRSTRGSRVRSKRTRRGERAMDASLQSLLHFRRVIVDPGGTHGTRSKFTTRELSETNPARSTAHTRTEWLMLPGRRRAKVLSDLNQNSAPSGVVSVRRSSYWIRTLRAFPSSTSWAYQVMNLPSWKGGLPCGPELPQSTRRESTKGRKLELNRKAALVPSPRPEQSWDAASRYMLNPASSESSTKF